MDGQGIAVLAGLAVAGGCAGAGGRWMLGRLARGAVVRLGWCESATGLAWAVVGGGMLGGGIPPWWVPVAMALSWFAVVLTATDLRHGRLPDALTLPAYPVVGMLLGGAVLAGADRALTVRAGVGAVLFLGAHAAVHLIAPSALGGGDVKLAGSLGAVLGTVGWPALVVATVFAALMTLGLRLAMPRRWPGTVPHGPGMLAATWLVAVFPAAGALASNQPC